MRNNVVIVVLSAIVLCGTAQAQNASDVELVVQEMGNAFNNRDIAALLSYISPEIKLYVLPDSLHLSGMESFRAFLGSLLEPDSQPPDFQAEFTRQIAQGNFVIHDGMESFQAFLGSLVGSLPPDFQAEAYNQIVQGNFVIQYGQFTGKSESEVAVYQVEQGKIVNLWLLS